MRRRVNSSKCAKAAILSSLHLRACTHARTHARSLFSQFIYCACALSYGAMSCAQSYAHAHALGCGKKADVALSRWRNDKQHVLRLMLLLRMINSRCWDERINQMAISLLSHLSSAQSREIPLFSHRKHLSFFFLCSSFAVCVLFGASKDNILFGFRFAAVFVHDGI